jgi:hypothetical protein
VDALALLEKAKTRTAVAGYDASFEAVRWEQKCLDCEDVAVGGKGKADIRRCFTRKGSTPFVAQNHASIHGKQRS